MSELVSLSGPWFWFIVAGFLLIGELLSPGVFLMWLAGAAAITGFVDLALGLGWSAEIIVFALVALVTVFATWKQVTSKWQPASDQPHLNQRHHAYVGRTVVLEQPIVNGKGKLKFEDALWEVNGPDLATGTRVKITASEGMRLIVEAA
jgi:inner membrane protein